MVSAFVDLAPASGSLRLTSTSAGRDKCRWSYIGRCKPAGTDRHESG